MTEAYPRITADLLYWGHLPVDPARTSPEAQDYRFERVLPLPVDRLHTARASLPDGSVVLVGIEPERLRSHLAGRSDVTPRTWDLIPDRLPGHIAEGLSPATTQSVLSRLNLLQAGFEPQPRRTIRRRIALVLNLGLLFAAILVVIGIERRSANLQQHAERLVEETRTIIGNAVTLLPTDRHPELKLTMEVRRLEQAAAASSDADLDPVAALSALWRVWPTNVRVQIEAVGAMQDRIVIRGSVPTLADAERIAQACRGVDPRLSLRAQPLQAQTTERGASFLLTLVHQPNGAVP